LPKLFEPLFRADASRTRTGQHGSGLGLSIVQAIVRAHRGSVTAHASPLGGVAIQVVLPLHPQRLERRKREP
jgi:two-component system sensor histidine kinase BaeS